MANQKLSQRPPLTTPPNGTDIMHVVNNGISKKVEVDVLADKILEDVHPAAFTGDYDDLENLPDLAAIDKTFVMPFSGLATIVVNHNLGKYPSVTVLSSAGDEIIGDITHNSVNQFTLTFNGSNTGTITCN